MATVFSNMPSHLPRATLRACEQNTHTHACSHAPPDTLPAPTACSSIASTDAQATADQALRGFPALDPALGAAL
eukprot:scaffold61864_cov13-Tisochrysis_lutea.AAC.1